MSNATAPTPGRLAYSVAAASKVLGVGVDTAARLVLSGELGSVSAGRRRIVPANAIHAYLHGLDWRDQAVRMELARAAAGGATAGEKEPKR